VFQLIGILAAVLGLALLNPIAGLIFRQVRRPSFYRFFTILVNQIEVLVYTTIIYFSGGIESSFLFIIYPALITYNFGVKSTLDP